MPLSPVPALPYPHLPDAERGLDDAADLAVRFDRVRARSRALAAPLSPEDAQVQSMEDCSPAKWHLAHTTWFFERFVLAARDGYVPFDADFDFLFNSYYQSVGTMHARPQRGLVTRPRLSRVLEYREAIDARMRDRLERDDLDAHARQVLLLGTHHEQQHQELLLTDIKHAFWCNPLNPAYRDDLPLAAGRETPVEWVESDERIVEVGAPAWPHASAFAYDNESPRHRVLVPAHALASRPVSNAEYRAFIEDGGYRNAGLWMSEGFARVQREGWARPLYWDEDLQREFTLGGMRDIDPHAPVCHISYFEADAYAGRRAAADGVRMGVRGQRARCRRPLRRGRGRPASARGHRRPWPASAVRRRLGMDVECVHALSGVPPFARFAGRIQRQVHVRPVGLARRQLRHPAGPRARQLP